MQCVVPLAGPQLRLPGGGLIANFQVDGAPLLRRAIETRSWWKKGDLNARGLTFVLRAGPELADLRGAVEGWFPGCDIVVLPGVTAGALLTALAGVSAARSIDEPLVIDLADILYDVGADMASLFAEPSVGAAVTYFEDRDPCYSYFEFNRDGDVRRAAEKQVVSSHASAGTYFFRTSGHFIAAAGRSIGEFRQELTVDGALFVCPVVNSIVRSGLRVVPAKALNVRSVSKLLHAITKP